MRLGIRGVREWCELKLDQYLICSTVRVTGEGKKGEGIDMTERKECCNETNGRCGRKVGDVRCVLDMQYCEGCYEGRRIARGRKG